VAKQRYDARRMDRVLLEEVFKIGGVPTYTFVEPSECARLRVALRTAGRGVVVEGPSGIGKSTAVSRALDELEPESGIQTLTARDPGDVGYIELLPETTDFGVVVIDDFHVLRDRTRRDIADLLKRLADTESKRSKLIIVGINRAGDSLIEHPRILQTASRPSGSRSSPPKRCVS
jgi:ABC-type ATPase involved in cell division